MSTITQRDAGRSYLFARFGSDPCLDKSAIIFGRLPDMRVCLIVDKKNIQNLSLVIKVEFPHI